ncbi:hypothetical protein D3C72_1694110 [compost metagenome]
MFVRLRARSVISIPGFFVMRFTSPPEEPRPYKTAAGPLITSRRSTFDRSRKYRASSRKPSTNWSPMAVKPRMNIWSRWPSPVDRPTPGMFFMMSWIDMAFWSRMTAAGTTLIVCGTSRSAISVLVPLAEVAAT